MAAKGFERMTTKTPTKQSNAVEKKNPVVKEEDDTGTVATLEESLSSSSSPVAPKKLKSKKLRLYFGGSSYKLGPNGGVYSAKSKVKSVHNYKIRSGPFWHNQK